MTLRLIVRTDDAGMAAHVGGDVLTRWRTFEIEAPELELFLRAERDTSLCHRQVVGVELLPAAPEPRP